MSRNLILVQAKDEGFLDPESNVYVSPSYPVVDFRNGFIETKINHGKAELIEDLPDTLWDEWLVTLRESNFVTEDALKTVRKSAPPKKTKAEQKAEEKNKEEAEKQEAEAVKARAAEVEAAKLNEQKNSPDANEEKKAEKAEAAADKKAD